MGPETCFRLMTKYAAAAAAAAAGSASLSMAMQAAVVRTQATRESWEIAITDFNASRTLHARGAAERIHTGQHRADAIPGSRACRHGVGASGIRRRGERQPGSRLGH